MRVLLVTGVCIFLLTGCSKPSAEEMYKKGEDAQRADQFDSAITLFQELIETYPDSARTPEAYYAIGAMYQNHKKSYHQAIQVYRTLVEKYPSHATAPSASFLIGYLYNNNLNRLDSARIAYTEFLQKYPGNQLTASAQFELENLGKDPGEILNAQSSVAQQPPKKNKEKKGR